MDVVGEELGIWIIGPSLYNLNCLHSNLVFDSVEVVIYPSSSLSSEKVYTFCAEAVVGEREERQNEKEKVVDWLAVGHIFGAHPNIYVKTLRVEVKELVKLFLGDIQAPEEFIKKINNVG